MLNRRQPSIMLLLTIALRTPDSAVELEAATKASLPDPLPLFHADVVLNVGQGVPDGQCVSPKDFWQNRKQFSFASSCKFSC